MAKNEAAVILGKLRMAKLSWAERSELGKLAARAKKSRKMKPRPTKQP